MAFWLDIPDARIAADQPPNAVLMSLYRERDKSSASKPLPITDVSPNTIVTHKGNLDGFGEVWTQGYTTRLFIPHDVPSGWVLHYRWISETYWDGTPGTGMRVEMRLALGGNYSPVSVQTALTTVVQAQEVVVPTSARGTYVDLAVEAWQATATQLYGVYLDPPKASHAGTVSIRRPA